MNGDHRDQWKPRNKNMFNELYHISIAICCIIIRPHLYQNFITVQVI